MEPRQHVGVVGLGLAGKAIAGRLLASGYLVEGYDVDPAARDAARTMGVAVADGNRQLTERCDLIILSLPDSAAVNAVLWGDNGVGATCRQGITILDATTARPSETVSHYERLRERGVRFIDVALSGSSKEIAAGTAVALVGDTEGGCAYDTVVRSFAPQIFFLGGPGLGHRAKLAVNLVLGLNRLALAEGLAFAKKAGLDGRIALELFRAGAAYSRVMDTKGLKMLEKDFESAARLAQHAKDVALILELAREIGARVPASALHATLLKELIDAGWGTCDNAAIIKAYEAT